MKKILSFFIIFLAVPFVLADITITSSQKVYNIGNKIGVTASALQDANFEGLFRLTLNCGNYKLPYFLTPVNLEGNFRTAITVPDLAATSMMLSNCSITGDLLTNDNLIVEEGSSNSFSVLNQLNVLPVSNSISALPGDAIQIVGIVNEAYGNNVMKAAVRISLDNEQYDVRAIDGKFNLTLRLGKNIKSGKHIIDVSASDEKNNAGSSTIELSITAVPIYIKTESSVYSLQPGSKVAIVSSLYDQADDLINATLDLELASQSGNKVFRKVVQSNEKIEYEFSQYAEPGTYVLTSAYKNLLSQAYINISAIRQVKIKYQNETVIVENVGNVIFEDELTFILESGSKKYTIPKKVKIEPGKTISIDLSREVPLGNYNIALPLKEGLVPIKEKLTENFENVVKSTKESLSGLFTTNNSILASDVTIHDNRPVYKKLGSGIKSMSSLIVGADGVLAKNPIAAPMIIMVIVLLIVFRYGRKPILRLIRGRRKDERHKVDEEKKD